MHLVWEQPFTVRYYELGASGLVQPVTLLNYLQEAADAHATRLGVGVAVLHARTLTWVLSRLRLQVARYAAAGETVLVRTWPSTRGALFTCREFELVAESREIVARATTSWAVLDLAQRRPVRIEEILPAFPLVPRRAIEDDFLSLPPCAPAGPGARFAVRHSDLDLNRHVNNAVYVGWALEAAPEQIVAARLPADIEVSFRAEAFAGDTVLARCGPAADGGGGRLLHDIVREADGKELARLRVAWAERPLVTAARIDSPSHSPV